MSKDNEIDYEKLKFKAGLEIHQQLDSGKLYCNCLSILRKDEPDFEVKRKLHAVAGESGEVDVAALYQSSLNKEFVYQGYDTTCLVELDEEPPHEINKEALKIAVQIGLLMNCSIVPITQIMRKTVIDGSNTSGFQRTVLIGLNGFIETSLGKVGIESIYLEEDAARIVSREEKKVVYKLDRLGLPLVEVVTEPDLKNAAHAKEVALKIGDILRSCKVRRGIGTIRQDINISIRGENRVEIKGMQDMKVFQKAAENEILRQKKLSDEGTPVEMEVRNVLKDSSSKFMRPLPGSARMYPETDLPLLKISRDFINEAKKDLPKLRLDVEKELKKKGLDKEMIKLLFKQGKLNLFEELVKVLNNPVLIGKMTLLWVKDIAKHEKKTLEEVEEILEDYYFDILKFVKIGKIQENKIQEVMRALVLGKSFEEATTFEEVELDGVEEFVMKIIKEKPGLSSNAYMGLVMKEFKGKIDGKTAREIIGKYIK
jgi:Glu-tRNA(Gln) amidotransferase subunit E-like FAD-binding protein